MRTRAVRFDHYGGREVLHLDDVEVSAGPGEVLVAVRAAGTNPGEAAIRSGAMDAVFPATFPSGQGSDLAGVVVEVGEGARGAWAVGDEVLGWCWTRASHAAHVAVPADQLVAKPAGLAWEVAGALYVAGATAHAAVEAVGAGAGDVVAVSAAAGGVGSLVVQLLRLRGAEVLAIASAANHDWLASLGATPVAYGDGLAQRLRAAVPPAASGIDAFIDTFGPEYVHLAIELGVAPERIDTIIAFEAAGQVGAKTAGSTEGTSTEVLAELAALAADGRLVVPVAAAFGLEQVREAFAELERHHTRGKIVLVP